MHSIVPFPRIEIHLMQKSAYGIFFSERRKYFLRPEKKGALDFKNPKLKKYCNKLIKLNWINSSHSFLISINLFCSSMYHSFWEIKILKSVNKLFFGQKYFLRPEKKGALDFKNLKFRKFDYNLVKLKWINSSNLFLIRLNLFWSTKCLSLWEIKVFKNVNKLIFTQKYQKVGKFSLICLLFKINSILLSGFKIREKFSA